MQALIKNSQHQEDVLNFTEIFYYISFISAFPAAPSIKQTQVPANYFPNLNDQYFNHDFI